MRDYLDFIAGKRVTVPQVGFEPGKLPTCMQPHQRDVTLFALRQGRAALFLDTGLGKTLCALAWAWAVSRHTNMPVLILTPVAVGPQFVGEAAKFGLPAPVRILGDQDVPAGAAVCLCNYERLHLLRAERFAGVVLDESSILKSFMGSTKRMLVEMFRDHRFRLACTATPAPNDYMELGNHADFLGVMASAEMLTRWFVTDQTEMGRYRLKRHAVENFWSWVASWARCVSMPSDLGHDDTGYVLPTLDLQRHMVATDPSLERGDMLFRVPDMSATAVHREKRLTISARSQVIADVVKREPGEPWVIWCDTDYEQDALMALLPEAVDVRGSQPNTLKERGLTDFATGKRRIIVTKPSIAGFGMNWQHCARVGFVGLSFSYEAFYQAVRRCWRFGQKRPVAVHVAMADTERSTWDAVSRKASDHDGMKAEMRAAMARVARPETVRQAYRPGAPMHIPHWLRSAA